MDACTTQPFDDIPGFGCYGPFGEKYGEASVELHGKSYRVDSGIYRQLHRWVLREQIVDSLRTLIAVDALHQTIH